jgi:deoxyadenosine/deoxycytidine kinase
VEGVIGAGKSELVLGLAAAYRRRGLRVGVALEPVDRWRAHGIMDAFYADPAKYWFGFQHLVFVTLVDAVADMVAATPDADIYIIERGPPSVHLFTALLMNAFTREGVDREIYRAMYDTWCYSHERRMPLDLSEARVLYLQTDVDVCMQRIASRNRKEEVVHENAEHKKSGVTPDYQQALQRAHEAMFLSMHEGEFPDIPRGLFPRLTAVDAAFANSDFRSPHGNALLESLVERLESEI